MLIFLRKLPVFITFCYCLVFSMQLRAQEKAESEVLNEIRSDFMAYLNKHDSVAYKIHHKILKKALAFNFVKYELGAYRKLTKDHALEQIGERNLDSILYYFDKYETRILGIDTSKLENKRLFPEMANYYMTKAEILENEFGLNDAGEAALRKAYPYLDKSNIDKLTRYDLKVSNLFLNKKQFDKSLAVATSRLKDTLHLTPVRKKALFDRIASVYIKQERYDKAYEFYTKSLKIAEQLKKEDQIWATKTRLNTSAFFYKDRQKAIDNALTIKKHYANAKKGKQLKGLNRTYIQLSDFYSEMKNIDSARYYCQEAIKINIKSTVLVDHYEKMAKFAMEESKYKSAVNYYRKRDNVKDSIKQVEKMLYAKYSDANIRLMKEKQLNNKILLENQLLEEKNNKQKLYIILSSVFLALLLLTIGLFFMYRKYKETNADLEVLKASEKELLEEQIRLRENELDVSTMAITQRVQVLNIIKAELDNVNDDLSKLEKLKVTLDEFITSATDISIVTERMESQYSKLTSTLKLNYPSLSQIELRYCLLTKLSLTLKETATLLNVTPETVKVARSRIKKKINIPTEITLKEYLEQY